MKKPAVQNLGKIPLKWQGEVVKVQAVCIKVTEEKERPLYWSNFEVDQQRSINLGHDYAIIEALKIWYRDSDSFYISNHFGIGIRKLRKGGWPNHTHFSFPDNCEEVDICRNGKWFSTTSFCLKDYQAHEAARREWQKKNFPVEFERHEQLRAQIKSFKR
ncbi:hypothetical protein [Muricauda sp. MAR_2010_75]|uniref:hypothetical protein n=1 Tax=Allomuricauda sp. MAR_2010_75 TaxID=1250232 RepID=UPI00056122CE|nr:hypothetical protein [Muricauda sp. MAR_2010_75]